MSLAVITRRRYKKIFIWCFLSLVTALLVLNGVSVFASSDEDSGGAKGWVKEDTFRVMNFAVLALILFFILKKPLSQALDNRIKGIEDQIKTLQEKKDRAEKKLVEYNEKLSQLEGESEKLIQEYIKQGEEARTRIIKEAEDTAVKLEEQAKRHIEHEFKQAKNRLQHEIFEKAIFKAEGIIKTNITAEDQDKLVDEYLDKVEA